MGYRDDITMQMSMVLDQIRAPLIVPALRLGVYICLTMSVMLFVERVYMGIVISLVKLFGRKPDKRFKYEPIKDDIELGNSAYPMVLIQIPMFNEREVPNHNSVLFFLQLFGYRSLLLLIVVVNAGLSTIYWSCLWTLMAF